MITNLSHILRDKAKIPTRHTEVCVALHQQKAPSLHEPTICRETECKNSNTCQLSITASRPALKKLSKAPLRYLQTPAKFPTCCSSEATHRACNRLVTFSVGFSASSFDRKADQFSCALEREAHTR